MDVFNIFWEHLRDNRTVWVVADIQLRLMSVLLRGAAQRTTQWYPSLDDVGLMLQDFTQSTKFRPCAGTEVNCHFNGHRVPQTVRGIHSAHGLAYNIFCARSDRKCARPCVVLLAYTMQK